jgi:Cu(I)/Ag(I) efflux system membrane fusion protein
LVVAVVAALGLFGAGLLFGNWLADHGPAVQAPERRVLFYRNPMNPAVTSPTPAKDEMGMDYIPVYESEEEAAAGVAVAPETANSLGVRTAAAERSEIARRIDSVGYVAWDEHRLSHIHLRAEGWIEQLRIHAAGEKVRRGEVLFHFYSPELVNAQEEFVLAREAKDARLLDLSRRRLGALGIPDAVIDALAAGGKVAQRLPVYAPQDGVVAELNAREGMFVARDSDVVTLVDLASVWVQVEVFEQQAAWVREGQRAEVRLAGLPGRVWQGRVDYLYPEVDPETRTLKVRLRFANPGAELKPNMYAAATIFAAPRVALNVPREAVIRTGEGARVILARKEGRFEPAAVEPGIESGDRVEILKGLQAGDQVVVSAQFLLDSEASLRAALRRMEAPEAATPKAAAATIHASGTVKRVDLTGRKLRLTHDPIAALGWPAMTMDFPVAPDVSLQGVAPGARVDFELVQKDPTTYEIRALRPAGGGR